jgi:diaminohydroxyphosphoribosylaminopyrimidine deaminase / 5-amino-6-(5-phosphoribosylamino)uracil reductase
MADDEHWMGRALTLAARGMGETNPNPMVGCIIVKAGRPIAEAYHRRAGGPHAEILALDQAGARARGATLYVNLEPCAHQGRTPPCAPRVAGAGLARVVAAMQDPNPLVSGKGIALVRRAGISVTKGVLEAEAEALNHRFMIAAQRTRPFLLLKAALTLDGRIGTANGDSRWITSPRQRREARRLRRLHDGVAVGIGTVLADDPLLLPAPRVRRPYYRIVFDSRLRLPPRSRLVRSARRSPVWVLCTRADARRRRDLESRGVVVLRGPSDAGRVSIPWAVSELWRRGLWSVMVEGGGELLGAFLAARLVDQVTLFRAPMLLGGRGSRPAFGGPDPARVRDGFRLSRVPPWSRGRNGATVGTSDDRSAVFETWYPA